jgi:hypothetical protein
MSQLKMMRAAQAKSASASVMADHSGKSLAVDRGNVYLSHAKLALATGDRKKALELTKEGIRLTNFYAGYLAVGEALRDLNAALEQSN